MQMHDIQRQAFRSGLVAALLAGAAIPSVAFAAEADAAAPTSLDEVVVTAQRRDEKLVDVPISVSVASGRQLEQAGVTSMGALAQVVPGLRMDSAGSYSQPSIRGVSSAISGPGLAPNVATYVDGFYRPNPIGNDFDFVDIRSVQVLKGPQGTLFGRNATGGAILVSTRDPEFKPALDARASYGRYDDMRGALFATAPLGDTLAASLSFYGRQSDGFIHNIVTGAREGDVETVAARGKLLWRPNDRGEVLLTLEHTWVDDPNGYLFSAYRGQTVGVLFPGVAIATNRGDVASNDPSRHELKSSAAFLRAKYDLGWATLTSLTGYQLQRAEPEGFDLDATALPIFAAYFPQHEDTITQEFNLAVQGERFNWVAGLFYMNERARMSLDGVSGGARSTFLFAGQTIDSYAAFVDGTYRVTDKLFLTLGGRYSYDDLSAHFGAAPLFARGGASKSFQGFDPRIAVRYELDANANIYASASRGRKSAAYNATGLSDVPVRPEKITAFETGYKTARPDWQFETAAFYYKYKDLQVNAYQGAVSTLLNAARAEIWGAEAHLAVEATENLRFDLGAAYTSGEYKSFPGAPHYVFSRTAGVTVSPEDATGNDLQRSPKFSGTVGVSYTHDFMGGAAQLSGTFAYQSKVYFDPFEDVTQKGYGVLNLRAAWTTPDERWTVAVFGRNLTDKKYIVSIVQEPTSILQVYAHPATYGVEIAFHY